METKTESVGNTWKLRQTVGKYMETKTETVGKYMETKTETVGKYMETKTETGSSSVYRIKTEYQIISNIMLLLNVLIRPMPLIIIMYIICFVKLLYELKIKPQTRREKKHQAMLLSLCVTLFVRCKKTKTGMML
jgi:hypothetical protein